MVPSENGREPIAKKPIYDNNGCLWRLYTFSGPEMAKDFRDISKKYRGTVSVKCEDGNCTIVYTIRRKRIFGF